MDTRTSVLFRNICFTASLLAVVDTVHAGVVTTGATVLSSEKFVINSASSSLAYNPGTFVFGTGGALVPSSTVNYELSGWFDATVWTPDGGSSKWLTISNVNLSTSNLPNGFSMPDFINSQLTGSTFSGNGDPCAYVPSGWSCSGFGGPYPTIAGQLQNRAISFNAFIPEGLASLNGGSTYQINATAAVVPVPAAFWLFASVLGLCGFKVRQKTISVDRG